MPDLPFSTKTVELMWNDQTMTESTPENKRLDAEGTRDFSHSEESITASGHSVGIEPSEDFVAPTMALDSLPAETDD